MNLLKKDGREAERIDRQSELDACRQGSWPRDLNDEQRWTTPTNWHPKDWAAHMCKIQLQYLKDLEERIAANDPDLDGCWER